MLSAIIVVYKTPNDLPTAVASLRIQDPPPDEIIVVDNGASEGAAAGGQAELGVDRVERPPVNLGFGAGCNLGARIASGDELLVLNADVVLEPEYLEARDPDDLTPATALNGRPVLVAVAATIGGARLIDNVLIEP